MIIAELAAVTVLIAYIFFPYYLAVSLLAVLSSGIRKREGGKVNHLSATDSALQYLLKDLLVFPIVSFFWLVDEILFRGYRNIEIKAPVFIVGQPRSGTTFSTARFRPIRISSHSNTSSGNTRSSVYGS